MDVLIREKTALFNNRTSSIGSNNDQNDKQQEVNELQLKEKSIHQEIEEKMKETKEVESQLQSVQTQRGDAFRLVFERVQQLVEPIYRQLSSPHGSATLFLENNKQPYL